MYIFIVHFYFYAIVWMRGSVGIVIVLLFSRLIIIKTIG